MFRPTAFVTIPRFATVLCLSLEYALLGILKAKTDLVDCFQTIPNAYSGERGKKHTTESVALV